MTARMRMRMRLAVLGILLSAAVLTAAAGSVAVPAWVTFENAVTTVGGGLLLWIVRLLGRFAKLLPVLADTVLGPQDYKGNRSGGLKDKVDALVLDMGSVRHSLVGVEAMADDLLETKSNAAQVAGAMREFQRRFTLTQRSVAARTRRDDIEDN